MKKILYALLASMLITGSILPVCAAGTELSNSNGLTSSEMTVEAQKNSSFIVGIPVNTGLNRNTGRGMYEISVKADIDSAHQLLVEPVDQYTSDDGDITDNCNFLLKNQAYGNLRNDVIATIISSKTAFNFNEVSMTAPVVAGVTIQTEKIPAGLWKGIIEYKISLKNKPIPLEPGLYNTDGLMLCTWEESGIDVAVDYDNNSYKTEFASPYYVMTNTYPDAVTAVIPNTVSRIGNYAFYKCSVLENVVLPKSISAIGCGAFSETNLTAVAIPDNVTVIENGAFSNCKNLKTVELSNNLATIKTAAFANCSALNSVIIPSSMRTIEASAFISAGIKSLLFEEGIENIGESAFCACKSLTSVVIPGSVGNTGTSTFSQCTALRTVMIEEGVRCIGDGTFTGCTSLENVTIPDSVTKIDNIAFAECTGLSDIIIPDSVESMELNSFRNVPHITYNGSYTTNSPWGAQSIN